MGLFFGLLLFLRMIAKTIPLMTSSAMTPMIMVFLEIFTCLFRIILIIISRFRNGDISDCLKIVYMV